MPDNDDLEAPDAWDWAASERRTGTMPAAVVVSVSLDAAEFEAVAKCAERDGVSVTEFVRASALDAAGERSPAP